jgi:antibiotic biosynthesis monooxygenase (ABM) superfamily enzyme
MYPHVVQFETRQHEFEKQIRVARRDRAAKVDAEGDELRRSRQRPPRYKLALLTWAAAYSVITLTLLVLGPTMASWPLGIRTLVLSVLMVASLTWLVMPAATKLFRSWLDPAA